MRTKTLLLAAAVMAVGIGSSLAQTYSQNVVGYINYTLPANHFALIGNQLIGPANPANPNGDNSVTNVLQQGLTSGTTTLYIFTGSGYNIFTYYNASDASPFPPGWYDGSGNICTNQLSQGSGAFLQNPPGSAITVTYVGTVPQGSVTNTVTTGFGIYAVCQPLSTNIDSTIVNFPASSGNDAYYHWNGTGFDLPLTYYNAADASPFPAGWYDGGGNLQSTNAAYWPAVGEGFYYDHVAAPSQWISTFNVP
jgi:hypothetical protein